MSDNTAIEWADRTWNPLLGCERVSSGCDGCYAISTATIRAGNPHPKVAAAFAGLTERRNGHLDWTGRINLLPERLTQPLTWRKPQKVFVNSQSDLFHKDVPDEFIHQVFAVMAATPQHTYQLLTKRHGRMRSLLRDECRCPQGGHQPGVHFMSAIDWVATPHSPLYIPGLPKGLYHQVRWPLPNVWVGVSVEDQKHADLRIPALRDTPAVVRWLSCEPLLGAVDLAEHLKPAEPYPAFSGNAWDRGDLAWVVAGGESGPGARPMHPHWVRSLRDQCTAAGVPYFFKQFGEWAPTDETIYPRDRRTIAMHPAGMVALTADNPFNPFERGYPHWEGLRRFGKKAAGRELDGQTWDEFPRVTEGAGR